MSEGYWITTEQHARCEEERERLRAAECEAWKNVAAGTKEIERLRADVAHWRAAAERAAADRTRELEACPYCRKHGEHAYSPCYLHGGCAEAKVEVLEDGMFKFTCPVCGVESGKVREQQKELERLRAELAEADRRAGEAERHNAELKKDASARRLWLSKAKKQWGVDDLVSFDVVWSEALTIRGELAAAKAVIENIVESEVEPLKALLREALLYGTWKSGNLPQRIRAALGDEPK